jgi:hypothetical protein
VIEFASIPSEGNQFVIVSSHFTHLQVSPSSAVLSSREGGMFFCIHESLIDRVWRGWNDNLLSDRRNPYRH